MSPAVHVPTHRLIVQKALQSYLQFEYMHQYVTLFITMQELL